MKFLTTLLLTAASGPPSDGSLPADGPASQRHLRPAVGAAAETQGTWLARVELPLGSPLDPSMAVLYLRFDADHFAAETVGATLCGIDFPARGSVGAGDGGPPPVRFEVQEGYFDDSRRLPSATSARWRASAQGVVFDIGPLVLTEGVNLGADAAWPHPPQDCFLADDLQGGSLGLPLQPRTDAGYVRPSLGMFGARQIVRQDIAARIELSIHATVSSADAAEGYADVSYSGHTGPVALCVRGCEVASPADGSRQACTQSQVRYANAWNERWEWRLDEVPRVKMRRVPDMPACVVVRNWDHT